MAAAAEVLWQPHPGPQVQALSSTAFELLYGGEAGGGKSDVLLIGALRWVHNPNFQGVIFRRTYPELKKGLIPRSWKWYRPLGATYHSTDHVWTFPSGAQVWLSNLEHDADVFKHQGPEYQYVGFDELPGFTAFQYRYLISRMRSTAGIPIRLRATCNPEPGWVRDRFEPWVRTAADYEGLRVPSGTILHYEYDEATETESRVERPTEISTSRQFIRARRSDNPSLMLNDPQYETRLNLLDPVQRRRLKGGDWEAEYAPGLMFQRTWFPIVDAAPVHAVRVRSWDRAATEVKLKGQRALQPQAVNDPDWSVGVLMQRTKTGASCIEDVRRKRGKPGDIEQFIFQTADEDEQKYGRFGFTILLEQEPGGSGIAEIATYMKLLARWTVVPVPHSADKLSRAKPASAQSQAGNISVLRAPWNSQFFTVLEGFPKAKHDDDVDAFSTAHNYLSAVPLESSGSSRGERKATNSGGF